MYVGCTLEGDFNLLAWACCWGGISVGLGQVRSSNHSRCLECYGFDQDNGGTLECRIYYTLAVPAHRHRHYCVPLARIVRKVFECGSCSVFI